MVGVIIVLVSYVQNERRVVATCPARDNMATGDNDISASKPWPMRLNHNLQLMFTVVVTSC
jgi:hypothetical protein